MVGSIARSPEKRFSQVCYYGFPHLSNLNSTESQFPKKDVAVLSCTSKKPDIYCIHRLPQKTGRFIIEICEYHDVIASYTLGSVFLPSDRMRVRSHAPRRQLKITEWTVRVVTAREPGCATQDRSAWRNAEIRVAPSRDLSNTPFGPWCRRRTHGVGPLSRAVSPARREAHGKRPEPIHPREACRPGGSGPLRRLTDRQPLCFLLAAPEQGTQQAVGTGVGAVPPEVCAASRTGSALWGQRSRRRQPASSDADATGRACT